MVFNGMAQGTIEQNLLLAISASTGALDIVQNKTLNPLFTIVGDQVVPQSNRDHGIHVLMLGDGGDFVGGEITHFQALFVGQHAANPLLFILLVWSETKARVLRLGLSV
jgi:hypothetical protein